jgi:YgiT-type zinc finger domain-containing protein
MIGAREGDNIMNNTKPRLCDFCGGELREQTLPYYDRTWQGKLYRFANVPALVCAQCGEKYFHATVSQAMEKILTGNEQPKRFEQVGVWELSLSEKVPA